MAVLNNRVFFIQFVDFFLLKNGTIKLNIFHSKSRRALALRLVFMAEASERFEGVPRRDDGLPARAVRQLVPRQLARH